MTNVLIRMGRIAAAVVITCLVCVVLPLQAQDVRVHISEDSVTVGQRFQLSITAEHDFAADPAFPEPADTLNFGDLEVLSRLARESFTRGDMRIDSIVYEVATFALDTAAVPPLPVLFTAGEDTFSVRTPPMGIPVISLVPPDAQDVRDLAPLVEFPRPIWPYIAGGAVLLLLAALLAFYLWKRRGREVPAPAEPQTPPEPPHVEAMKRLQALEQTDLDHRDAIQPFYTELSDVIRHYLARRLHVNAKEMTTRELIRKLAHQDLPNADTRRELQIVLSLADYVKFADAEPSPEEGRNALSKARGLVQSVEDALRPAEPSADELQRAGINGQND